MYCTSIFKEFSKNFRSKTVTVIVSYIHVPYCINLAYLLDIKPKKGSKKGWDIILYYQQRNDAHTLIASLARSVMFASNHFLHSFTL